MKRSILIIAASISFIMVGGCGGVRQLNNLTPPIIPIAGCPGGFALRAKNAKIIHNDTLALGLVTDLAAAAKADSKVTDSLLTTGAKGSAKGNLTTTFKRYFEVDQSVSDDIWNQQSAFAQLFCMLDKMSSDPLVSQSIRDSVNLKKISLITTQASYIRNVQKKSQN